MRRSPFQCLLLIFLLFIAHALSAQQRTIAPSHEPANLREVTARAATIFVGRVIYIKPMPVAGSGQVGSVQITFQVEQGVRGTRAGEQFSFREWAGLWSELDRYRIGAEVRTALAANDVPFLARRTNAYLLRYYFFATGMKDEEFMRRLRHG